MKGAKNKTFILYKKKIMAALKKERSSVKRVSPGRKFFLMEKIFLVNIVNINRFVNLILNLRIININLLRVRVGMRYLNKLSWI